MSSKMLCLCVRFASVAALACGIGLLILLYAVIGSLTPEYPQYSAAVPWRAIVAAAALPCSCVLVCMWAVSNAIAGDTVFTGKTAKWIERAALLLFTDAGFVFFANVWMLMLSFSHLSILLAGLIVTFVLVALGLLAAVLSRYVQKAADLQTMNEGTI